MRASPTTPKAADDKPLPDRFHPWITGALADAAGTARCDLDSLGQCPKQCGVESRLVATLRCGLDALHRSMLGCFVTSLGVLVALVGVPLLLW